MVAPVQKQVASAPGYRANSQTFEQIPSFLSFHSQHEVTMPLQKAIRDAAVMQLNAGGSDALASVCRREISRVVFNKGTVGSFGKIRFAQKDIAAIGGFSPAFVAQFLKGTHVPDFSFGSQATALEEYAFRFKCTPTDPNAGLSPAVLAVLPDPADVAASEEAQRQKLGKGRAACGGRAIGGGAGGTDPSTVVARLPKSSQGTDEKLTKMRMYLIQCTKRYCASTLTYEMQKSMGEVLWRIQCGLDPNGNEPNPHPMDPEFFATCVAEPFKAAERMGIASWWQSYGIPHRMKHCHKKEFALRNQLDREDEPEAEAQASLQPLQRDEVEQEVWVHRLRSGARSCFRCLRRASPATATAPPGGTKHGWHCGDGCGWRGELILLSSAGCRSFATSLLPPPSSPVPPLVALVPRSFPALFSCVMHARTPAPPATDGRRVFIKNRSGRLTGWPLNYDQHAKSKQMNALHCHFGRLALRSSAGETWRMYGGHGLVYRQPVDLKGIHMESDQDLQEI